MLLYFLIKSSCTDAQLQQLQCLSQIYTPSYILIKFQIYHETFILDIIIINSESTYTCKIYTM